MEDDPRWPTAGRWLEEGPGDGPADLAVLGVPAHLTSLSATGAHATPGAIRDALWRLSTYAWLDDTDLSQRVAPLDLGDVLDPDADEQRTIDSAAEGAGKARLLVALGGDNSITYAVARGVLGADLGRAGLVTVDAHHDVRDGVNNGSPVRRLVEAGLDPRRVVQMGIADWANSAFYAKRVRDWGITVVTRDELHLRPPHEVVRRALETAGSAGGPVYVDLDVDVCDRSVAPACPASLPGGISGWELRVLARLLASDPRVRAVDITEVDATADAADGRTVRLAAMLLLETARGLAARHG